MMNFCFVYLQDYKKCAGLRQVVICLFPSLIDETLSSLQAHTLHSYLTDIFHRVDVEVWSWIFTTLWNLGNLSVSRLNENSDFITLTFSHCHCTKQRVVHVNIWTFQKFDCFGIGLSKFYRACHLFQKPNL